MAAPRSELAYYHSTPFRHDGFTDSMNKLSLITDENLMLMETGDTGTSSVGTVPFDWTRAFDAALSINEMVSAAQQRDMTAEIKAGGLNEQANYYEVMAEEILIQAQQQQNIMQESFNQTAGSYIANRAQSGFKVSSQSTFDMVERSGENLSEDKATLGRNAQRQSDQYKRQAEYARETADALRKQQKAADDAAWVDSAIKIAGFVMSVI